MQTIETELQVDEQGIAVLRVRTSLSPGRHSAVLVVQDEVSALNGGTAGEPGLPKFSLGAWPEGLELRRSALYDERGR